VGTLAFVLLSMVVPSSSQKSRYGLMLRSLARRRGGGKASAVDIVKVRLIAFVRQRLSGRHGRRTYGHFLGV